MFLFEHILLTTRFKWCDLNDLYCVIMLTMMIKITLVYNNKTYKAYKVYNNWCTTTKHTKCTATGVQQQNIQSVQQRSTQSIQSVQQQSIKNALCTVVMHRRSSKYCSAAKELKEYKGSMTRDTVFGTK